MEAIVVYVTVSCVEEGERMAGQLVQERLVACVNSLGPIQSTYWWNDQIYNEPEYLLMIKTRSSLLESLTERICTLHSYEVPEVIAVPIIGGSQTYLDWIFGQTKEA